MDPIKNSVLCLQKAMASRGFVFSGVNGRRLAGSVVQCLLIQPRDVRDSVAVNMGVHFVGTPSVGGKVIQWDRMTQPMCDIRERARSQRFAYQDGPGACWLDPVRLDEVSCRALLEEEVEPFFDRFKTPEQVLESVRPSDLETERLAMAIPGLRIPRASLLLARLASSLGRVEEAAEYAVIGVRHIGHAKGLISDLNKFIAQKNINHSDSA